MQSCSAQLQVSSKLYHPGSTGAAITAAAEGVNNKHNSNIK
jgi:hypothetical protein